MGYHMRQMGESFSLRNENRAAALAAIKRLAGEETIRESSGAHFAWVRTSDFAQAETLEDALRVWRWEPEVDKQGNIEGLWFHGEKLGDDKVLLEAIAPYVEPGSSIQMIGEDDSIWQWRFDGKTVHEEAARIVFE